MNADTRPTASRQVYGAIAVPVAGTIVVGTIIVVGGRR